MSLKHKSGRESKSSVQRSKTSVISNKKEIMQPLTPIDVFMNKSKSGSANPYTSNTSLSEYFQKFKVIKDKAIKAIRQSKIFILSEEFGKSLSLRQDLQNRGWVEKSIIRVNSTDTLSHQTLLEYAVDANEFERKILSNLVADYPADLVFTPQRPLSHIQIHDFALWNRINIGYSKNFTYKDGLWRCSEDAHFSTIPNKAELNLPRSFVVKNGVGFNEFQDDYHLTLCRNLIYFLNENREMALLVVVENPKKGSDLVEASLVELICDFLTQRIQVTTDHIDIEESFLPINIKTDMWNKIAQACIDVVEGNYKICIKSEDDVPKLQQKIEETATSSLQTWPFSRHDGFRNIWIVKPSNKSCGSGILLYDKYEQIVSHVKATRDDCRTIIQKYIERPLLIHKSKFDIRYFFMVQTDLTSVKVWDYQMCYLRFASAEFDLKDTDVQIHLTNHAIQRFLENRNRSEKLPVHNMWHQAEFQEYLTSIGHVNVWTDKIHPAIKKNLIGMVVAALEEIECKAKRFQIFGADFLITDDFDVYLLECNNSPALVSQTTVVTEIVFKAVLADALKGLFCPNFTENHTTFLSFSCA